MGIVSAIALGIGALAMYQGNEARQDAKEAANRSAEEQRKAQSEVKAQNAQKAAMEARQQVRERRIRAAKIMQGAYNSGAGGSSGELGAVGGLSTSLSSNLGFNAGMLASSNRISNYNQTAADFSLKANNALMDAQGYDQLFGLSTNIFTAAGGFGPKTPATANKVG